MAISIQQVSKSQFKSQLLGYLRQVEQEKQPLIVTHRGKPVVKVSPYKDKEKLNSILASLRHTVVSYRYPAAPGFSKQRL